MMAHHHNHKYHSQSPINTRLVMGTVLMVLVPMLCGDVAVVTALPAGGDGSNNSSAGAGGGDAGDVTLAQNFPDVRDTGLLGDSADAPTTMGSLAPSSTNAPIAPAQSEAHDAQSAEKPNLSVTDSTTDNIQQFLVKTKVDEKKTEDAKSNSDDKTSLKSSDTKKPVIQKIKSDQFPTYPRRYFQNLLRFGSMTTVGRRSYSTKPDKKSTSSSSNPIISGRPAVSRRRGSRPCSGTCEKMDSTGVCRVNFACTMNMTDGGSPDMAEASIISMRGCARCYRKDYSGRCRLHLTCLLGYTDD